MNPAGQPSKGRARLPWARSISLSGLAHQPRMRDGLTRVDLDPHVAEGDVARFLPPTTAMFEHRSRSAIHDGAESPTMATKAMIGTTTALCLLSLALPGCIAAEAAHLQVQVTVGKGGVMEDHIGDFQRLDVTVTKAKVHRAGTPGDSDAPGAENADGWTTIDVGKTVDLAGLQNGHLEELLNETLPAGRYTQVRLVVEKATGILRSDGSTVDVRVPDHQLRFVQSFDAEEDKTTTYTLDIHIVKQGVVQPEYSLAPRAGTVVGPR
jgi:hypothetical protein